MAVVYRAVDTRLHRQVAIKVMHGHLAEDPEFRRRFEQEARNTAGLSHPNLVNVYDQGEEGGYVYLVMEYLPGITLRDLLKQQQRLTMDQAVEIGTAILSGLAAAHSIGMIHRDLKPENVLLADDGRIKLGDFGLARAASANTMTGQALLGTIAYLSPELVTRGVADTRSDIYAFGIMLFEMLTGSQPFQGDQPMQIAYQHAHDDVPVPSSLTPESTPALDEVVRWATAKDPEERPADAAELLRSLQGIILPGGVSPETRILNTGDLALTGATTVLPRASGPVRIDSASLHEESADDSLDERSDSDSPLGRAARSERRRAKRGGLFFVLALALTVAAAATGLYFGHGPGSLISVPDVVGVETETAQAMIAEAGLTSTLDECSHLTIAVGHVAETDPTADARVEREGTVRLCISTGPAILDVPSLEGLPLDDAVAAIEGAGFTFGSVTDQYFTAEVERDVVIGAFDAEGAALGDSLPEQSTIDLVTSAGQIPSVDGMAEGDAIALLADVDLIVDAELRGEQHSDDVPAGSVITLNLQTDPVRPGDPVSLTVSLGPELFDVPATEGLSVREAMTTLENAGFNPSTSMLEILWDIATVTRTEPEAGSKVPRGTDITVRATVSL